MSDEFTQLRNPTQPEKRLLQALFSRCDDCTLDWLPKLLVRSMRDGGMGSLKLHLEGVREKDAAFGRRAAELQFTDADGVEVIVSLNLSKDGLPFEMDVWKTNYSPLLKVPERFEPAGPE